MVPWALSPPILLYAMKMPKTMPRVPKTRREIARAISLIGGRLWTMYEGSIIISSSVIEKAWSTYAIAEIARVLDLLLLALVVLESLELRSNQIDLDFDFDLDGGREDALGFLGGDVLRWTNDSGGFELGIDIFLVEKETRPCLYAIYFDLFYCEIGVRTFSYIN